MGTQPNRRTFLKTVGVAAGMTAFGGPGSAGAQVSAALDEAGDRAGASVEDTASAIDFRYSPLSWQTAFCFPDDPHKSLVGERGELRYGHPGHDGKGLHYFSEVVEFSVLGMEHDQVQSQGVERPGIPIVHSRIDRPEAFLEFTTFATNLPDEGRVDNVVVEVIPRTEKDVHAVLQITVRSESALTLQARDQASAIYKDKGSSRLFLLSDAPLSVEDWGYQRLYRLAPGKATYLS